MSLTSQFRSEVSSEIRCRGEEYYYRGAVTAFSVDPRKSRIEATVIGSSAYHVEIRLDSRNVVAWECDCAYFDDHYGEACKHVWAVLLAADRYLKNASGSSAAAGNGGAARPKPVVPEWKKQLATMFRNPKPDLDYDEPPARQADGKEQEFYYVIDAQVSRSASRPALQIVSRQRKIDGNWGKPKVLRPGGINLSDIRDAADREFIATLRGGSVDTSYSYGYGYGYYGYTDYIAPPMELLLTILPRIAQTGRLRLRNNTLEELPVTPLLGDGDAPWDFAVRMRPDEKRANYRVDGILKRAGQEMALGAPRLLLAGGLLFFDDRFAPLNDHSAFGWICALRERDQLLIPIAQVDDFLSALFTQPQVPPLDVPPELNFSEATGAPRPRLMIRPGKKDSYYPPSYKTERLLADLSFDYEGVIVSEDAKRACVYDAKHRRVIHRDGSAETAAIGRMHQLGVRPAGYYDESDYRFAKSKLGKIVRTLAAEGWHIEAQGKLYRRPGQIDIQVTSGIDWFDLEAKVDFDGRKASLPALLAAIKRGEDTIVLDDGTLGMLPEDWLKKYGFLASAGEQLDGKVRFTRTQAGLLDALLASQPQAKWDEAFERTRQQLRSFEGIKPADPPEQFQGQLRPYQRDGLGWFSFLEQFGFGGCLADDMGLGKTVQVLALLDARRQCSNGNGQSAMSNGQSSPKASPSLVVVPKSLVFNWKAEAARFTPDLRILDHTGDRIRGTDHLGDYDIVLTTYGTLRRDVTFLKDIEFDYAILDEAQAIKNPASESAKAARLIQARRRLALSGTPVQNHLGDLWSLFDFLNPGMLGSAAVFSGASSILRNPDQETRTILSKAVRPFILRRTKEQVAADLPEKLEQTIYCDLDKTQRKLYDELRDHYRQSLLKQVDTLGMNRSKIQILEALLRLRQAAIHPGLIDKARAAERSAKLDNLLARLAEVVDEGHKALVFSQFTSMLAIVRNRLDEQKIKYEYLDGQTRDREQRVTHFQSDPACKLFLISLKAGGLGLNLTAADYVFLLDPWWNPAIEQQAIDRTHRIGQTQKVYACRLIAKDTVEEKVLALQQTKRDLADAIINADNSLIRSLGREDLELLLS